MKRASWMKGVTVAAAVVVGLGLAGCGSDSSTEETSAPETNSSPAAGPAAPGAPGAPGQGAPGTPGTPPAGPKPHFYTIVDFIRDNKVAETQLHAGDPGAPRIEMPMPPGWVTAGDKTPAWAWSAIYDSNPAVSVDPPNIVTLVSKLTGTGVGRVLSYAPGELRNMKDFQGDQGAAKQVSGFNAWEIGGTFTRNDGAPRAIVQTTVVFPAPDGVYVMQHNGDGTPDQLQVLRDTMQLLDAQTKITPP
jgi:Probable lipoprotein LpqN